MNEEIYVSDKEFEEKGYVMQGNQLLIDGEVTYIILRGGLNGMYVRPIQDS